MTAVGPSLRRLSYPLRPGPLSEPADYYLLPLSAVSTSGTGSAVLKPTDERIRRGEIQMVRSEICVPEGLQRITLPAGPAVRLERGHKPHIIDLGEEGAKPLRQYSRLRVRGCSQGTSRRDSGFASQAGAAVSRFQHISTVELTYTLTYHTGSINPYRSHLRRWYTRRC